MLKNIPILLTILALSIALLACGPTEEEKRIIEEHGSMLNWCMHYAGMGISEEATPRLAYIKYFIPADYERIGPRTVEEQYELTKRAIVRANEKTLEQELDLLDVWRHNAQYCEEEYR